jgi:uncharacterized membrane protein
MIAELAISVVWILASALMFRLLSVWDQLPERVAVHFGASLQPDGWGRKSTMALLIVLVVVGHAVFTTWLVLTHGQGSEIVATILLATATILFSVFWQAITFNISGKPLKAIWIVLPVLLIVGAIAALLSRILFLHPVR